MAVHFHPLVISKIKKETADSVSVSFKIPEALAEDFLYKEGQSITIKTTIDGQELRRSYSLCTAPFEKEIKVAIKKVPGGLFSSFANNELKEGDELELLPPVGKFNAKFAAHGPGNYLAFAAGSGITPVISIIKHTLQTQADSNFTLVFGNKNRQSIIFFEELEGLKNKFMNRFNFINILSREKTDAEIFYGRIDRKKIEALGNLLSYKSYDDIYICGPEEMIFTARDYFTDLGINSTNIHFELFTTPGQKQSITPQLAEEATTENAQQSNITIKLDGRSFDFKLGQTGLSILDAALQQGADLPYACKGGVCCTCRAKLVSGEVSMDVNYALEAEEVEQGFILTCQSHPLTENVLVDFDVK